jgi:hypothetical protein
MIRTRTTLPRALITVAVAATLGAGLLGGGATSAATAAAGTRPRPHGGVTAFRPAPGERPVTVRPGPGDRPVPAGVRAAKSRIRPTGDTGITISLTTSGPENNPLAAQPGQYITLTATTNFDVGPTPWYIEIYDAVFNNRVAVCGAGTTCSVAVTESSPTGPGYAGFKAFVAGWSPEWYPPDVQASSGFVEPSWLNPLNVQTFDSGGFSLQTDSGGALIVPPWSVEVADVTTGQIVAACNWYNDCTWRYPVSWANYNSPVTGCVCMEADLSPLDTYQVVIATNGTYPPADIRAASTYV